MAAWLSDMIFIFALFLKIELGTYLYCMNFGLKDDLLIFSQSSSMSFLCKQVRLKKHNPIENRGE